MIDPAVMNIELHDDVVIVRLAGEIDMGNADRLGRRVVGDVLDAPGPARPLVVELTGLDYIDSSGLRMLEEIRHAVASKGLLMFTIAPPICRAHRLLVLTGLTDHLATQPDLSQVRAALLGRPPDPD
jgi:stage II sporulation protein AA (anti-sigma F factor antagonist)